MYCLLNSKINTCHREQESLKKLFSKRSGMVIYVEKLTTLVNYLIAQEHSVI